MTKDGSNKVPGIQQITLRSWPKVIFLYPVMITSFACGLVQTLTGGLDSQRHRFEGQVSDSTGTPVANAALSLTWGATAGDTPNAPTQQSLTDATGSFAVSLTQAESFSVNGKVTDINGDPLPSAQVTISRTRDGGDPVTRVASTNSKGRFGFVVFDAGWTEAAGMIFFLVLCLNLLVISFEFSRFKTMAIFFFCIAFIFGLLYLGTRWEVFAFITEIFAAFRIKASSSFYYGVGIYLMIMFIGVFVQTRFDYWIIRSNEILHKEGFLGDVRRFPSPNLKMTKEITDVFEFVLLGAGKVVLYPAGERQSIVLDHVLGVNRAERSIQDLLSALSVEITGQTVGMDDKDEQGTGIGIGD